MSTATTAQDHRTVDLDIVIVNYNTADLLEQTLEHFAGRIPERVRWTVHVADNDSADDSVERVRRRFPEVDLIEMGENAGFCRGNNAAIRRGAAEYVLLINTDARLLDGTLEQMIDVLEADPTAAVVGPRLEFADGRFQSGGAGADLNLWSYLMWTTGLERFADRFPELEGSYTTRDHGRAVQVGWVCSACMLLRRSAIEQVGLMDERIFLYMDDVDLCTRLREEGWTVWYRGDVRAVHFMSGGERRRPGTISPHTVESMVRWFERRHGRAPTLALRATGTMAHGIRGVGLGARYLAGRHDGLKDRAIMNLRLARYYLHTGVESPLGAPPTTATEETT